MTLTCRYQIKMLSISGQSPELAGRNVDFTVDSAYQLLDLTAGAWGPTVPGFRLGRSDWNLPILLTSFHGLSSCDAVIPQGNAFVNGILRAFQQDLHLILRPDDLWLAILTQFSLFVKGNPEDLRKHFVAHNGLKDFSISVEPYSVQSLPMVHFQKP